MKSRTKKRLIVTIFYSVLVFWSALGLGPGERLGLPLYVWLFSEAALLGIGVTVTGAFVYDWAERDD